MTRYKYLCSERPPMPGAIPNDGLVAIEDPPDGVETVVVDGKEMNCWGYVIYSRPLTNGEMSDYELTFMCTQRVYIRGGGTT